MVGGVVVCTLLHWPIGAYRRHNLYLLPCRARLWQVLSVYMKNAMEFSHRGIRVKVT